MAATTSMAGGMYLCAGRIEKFGGTPPSTAAAVATAVVSNPVAKNTTSRSGRARASSSAWTML
jgi:hypothetical protein